MQRDVFCFRSHHDWNAWRCCMLNLLVGQNVRGKMFLVFQPVCQHHYLSCSVSLLIKMNGYLMTRFVSLNVTFVFIFHPNIPLTVDSRVYKPFPLVVWGYNRHRESQPQPYCFSHFPFLPPWISPNLYVFVRLQSLLCFELLHQVQIRLSMTHFALPLLL